MTSQSSFFIVMFNKALFQHKLPNDINIFEVPQDTCITLYLLKKYSVYYWYIFVARKKYGKRTLYKVNK